MMSRREHLRLRVRQNGRHLLSTAHRQAGIGFGFRLEIAATDFTAYAVANHGRKPPRKHNNSESDWAWVSSQLRQGKDAAKLTPDLAARPSDKPNPPYYAQRTIDVAAHLWLLERIRTEDVITMLECRRRFDVLSALCFARAREIAATAERMITRRKSA